jgi:hypothetical protein
VRLAFRETPLQLKSFGSGDLHVFGASTLCFVFGRLPLILRKSRNEEQEEPEAEQEEPDADSEADPGPQPSSEPAVISPAK